MQLLKDRISRDAQVLPGGVIKVSSFLNHMIDTALAKEIAVEFARRFQGTGVTKVLTIEASGIAFAVLVGVELGVPVVFAKKTAGSNTAGDSAWSTTVRSYTKGTECTVQVSRQYLTPDDRVLIVDDFLAYGEAVAGLGDLVRRSGGTLCGAGIVIEKAYEPGGAKLREAGIRVESLARISSIEGGVIRFSESV